MPNRAPIIAYPSLLFSQNSMPRLTCMTCGGPMLLILIEPMKSDFDVRTFHCHECNVAESFVIDLSQP